jgi:hypothetical protein
VESKCLASSTARCAAFFPDCTMHRNPEARGGEAWPGGARE